MSTAAQRAAVYHRGSTLDQNRTLLRSELRAAAKRLGYRIVVDVEGCTSTTGQRPAKLRATIASAS